MAKLTKKDRAWLRSVLKDAERALAMVQDRNTVVCVSVGSANGACYTPHSAASFDSLHGGRIPLTVAPIDKDIGSALVGLASAVDGLAKFLATH